MNSRIISDLMRDPLMPFDVVARNKITHIQSSFYPEPYGATIAIQLSSKPKLFLQNGSSSRGIHHPFAGDGLLRHTIRSFTVQDLMVGIPVIQNYIIRRNTIFYGNT